MKIHLPFTFNIQLSTPRRRRGMYLPVILMATTLFLAYAVAIMTLAFSNVKMANLHGKHITAMQIAEAGINYYMWHLAHNNLDYCDGVTPCPDPNDGVYGPFHHPYKNLTGDETLGTYDLYITPPTLGNSITTVKSVGKVSGISPEKTIVAQLGIPSFTKYTLLVNGVQLWVGSGEKVTGSVHVNDNGLYNQGEITGDASSTEPNYHDIFLNVDRLGVSGSATAKWGGAQLFPVPRIDFNQVNIEIIAARQAAMRGAGDYYEPTNGSKKGYHIILGTTNYTICEVTGIASGNAYDIESENCTTSGMGPKPYNVNGLIFTEDNVWVDGMISNQKQTIIAADPSATASDKKKTIYLNGDIKYTYKTGSDKIGLVSQTNILLVKNAPQTIEIDAAMVAKDGEIKIQPYSNEFKDKITVYGSMAHKGGILWTYADEHETILSGYRLTETIMDYNNVLNPPPNFPKTGSYMILSWREE